MEMEMREDEGIYATIYPIPKSNPCPSTVVFTGHKNHIYTVEPSAPPAPWYYNKYRPEVLSKAYLLDEWYERSIIWQYFYLEAYYIRYLTNDLP